MGSRSLRTFGISGNLCQLLAKPGGSDKEYLSEPPGFDPWVGRPEFNPWVGRPGFDPWVGRPGFDPWVGRIPWRAWKPTPAFLLGESHGQRSL